MTRWRIAVPAGVLLLAARAQELVYGYCSCPSGNDPYVDETECEAAATALGLSYGGSRSFWWRTYQGPAGCWYRSTDNTVFWNPSTGAGCETVQCACVCVPGATTTSSTDTTVTTSSSTATATSVTTSSSTVSSATSSSTSTSGTSSTTATSTTGTSSSTSSATSSSTSSSSTVSNSTTTASITTSFSSSSTISSTSSTVSETSSTTTTGSGTVASPITSTTFSSTLSSTSSRSTTGTVTTSSSSFTETTASSTGAPFVVTTTPGGSTSDAASQSSSSSSQQSSTSSDSAAPDDNTSNTTQDNVDWSTTPQLSFAMAGCYSSDVLSYQGLLDISWVMKLPSMAFGGFMGVSILLLFCLVCSSPPPLPLLELSRGETTRKTPPRRKLLGGWSAWIIDRCTLYIRCYKASLSQRTLLLVQEGTMDQRQTWADAREEAALVANLRTQTVFILESFASPSGGMLSRFRMLWPALQPWREVTFFDIFSSRLERAARLLSRLTVASALAVIARQAFYGAFKRHSNEVCDSRPQHLAEALPAAAVCCFAARFAWLPLYGGFMQQYRCRCLRWVVVTQGLLSSSVIVVLFLANTSDADGTWWFLCFILIFVLDLGFLPFLATLFWVLLSTLVLTCNYGTVRVLREQLPPLHKAPPKPLATPPAPEKARVTINSEPSVVEEPPKSLLNRTDSKEHSKAQVGQVLSVLPGSTPEEDAEGVTDSRRPGRDALSVLRNWT